MPKYYYAGPWQQHTEDSRRFNTTVLAPPLNARAGLILSLDLSGLPKAGLFVFDKPINDPSLIFLGTGSLSSSLPNKAVQRVSNLLGRPLDASVSRASELLNEIIFSDSELVLIPKRTRFSVHLGDEAEEYSFTLPRNDSRFNKVYDKYRRELRKLVNESPEAAGKFLWETLRRLEIPVKDWKQFVPPDLQNKVRPIPPTTQFSDSFTYSGTVANNGWTVFKKDLLGDGAQVYADDPQGTSGYAAARYSTALGSDDHFVEIEIYDNGGLAGYGGPLARQDTSSQFNCYYAECLTGGGQKIFRWNNDTATNLANNSTTFVSGAVEKIDVNGSTIKQYYNGSLIATVTDTSPILGNLYPGMTLYFSDLFGSSVNGDNWLADDGIVTGTVSDTLTISETYSVSEEDTASISDTFTITDSFTAGEVVGSISDTLTFSDQQSSEDITDGSYQDTVTLSETYSSIVEENVSFSESITLSETYNSYPEIYVSWSETVDLTDTVSAQDTTESNISDTVSILDSSTGVVEEHVSISDYFSIIDYSSGVHEETASFSEQLTITDSVLTREDLVGGVRAKASKFPFRDDVTLTSYSGNFIPEDMFIDAKFYVTNEEGLYLSSIKVQGNKLTFEVSTEADILATAEIDVYSSSGLVVFYDSLGRQAGILVSLPENLQQFVGWGDGIHYFSREDTEFVASVSVPTSIKGVEGFLLPNGEFVSGDVWLIGGDGVILEVNDVVINGQNAKEIVVNIVGDALFREKECEDKSTIPTFVRNIIFKVPSQCIHSRCYPDESGNIIISTGTQYATESVLRISPDGKSLKISIVGDSA